mmetsp:Transcript_9269/g.23073  ORF Transcript_9269/g.23073 Transcript_9269/m.23073 type:complete len:267 (-) Transcript_9269:169-969(-)
MARSSRQSAAPDLRASCSGLARLSPRTSSIHRSTASESSHPAVSTKRQSRRQSGSSSPMSVILLTSCATSASVRGTAGKPRAGDGFPTGRFGESAGSSLTSFCHTLSLAPAPRCGPRYASSLCATCASARMLFTTAGMFFPSYKSSTSNVHAGETPSETQAAVYCEMFSSCFARALDSAACPSPCATAACDGRSGGAPLARSRTFASSHRSSPERRDSCSEEAASSSAPVSAMTYLRACVSASSPLTRRERKSASARAPSACSASQ